MLNHGASVQVKDGNTSLGKGSGNFKPSGKGNQCPICGRNKDGDCRIGAGIVLCHHGSSCHPPEGLKPGDTINGNDGQQWAYTKETTDGRSATFVIHQPLQEIAAPLKKVERLQRCGLELAKLPEAKAEPPSHLSNGQRLIYSDTQTVVAVVNNKSKKHIPHHINESGKEIKGAGLNPWPLYRQSDAIKYGAGKWIIETEGEKCALWPRAAGLVAVSQPGHDTKEESISNRYKTLKDAGVAGVAYLADNDKTGTAKGNKCQKAAAAVGLPFLLLHAAEVWPGICAGGSIDDAPGNAQERAQTLEIAIQKETITKKVKSFTPKDKSDPITTGTGIQAVLNAQGWGWIEQKNGPPIRQEISIGDLSVSLTSKLKKRLEFDELALAITIDRVALKDWEISLLHGRLSENGWIIGSEAATGGLLLAARRNPFHPVVDYLKRVEADPAIEAFDLDEVAPRFFRATSALHRTMVRKWLIGAVARAMEPGCQMDYCLVAQSDIQGLGKSGAFRDLASPDWFTCTIPSQDKDLTQNIHCCWIFELAELEAFTGAKAAGKIKNTLTTLTDLIRVPYGKTPERMPRASVFCATVNKREFLRDDTGNRRFWVVPIEGTEKLDRAGLVAARDGIWKAAVLAYRSGELPMLPDGLANDSEQQNDDFRELDPWLELLSKFLDRQQQENQIPVASNDILRHMGVTTDRQSPKEAKRVRELAESLGWRHKSGRTADGKRKLGLWPQVATHTTQKTTHATQATTQAHPSDANRSSQNATHTTQKTKEFSVESKKEQQEQQKEEQKEEPDDKCSVSWVVCVASPSDPSDSNGTACNPSPIPWVACVAPLANPETGKKPLNGSDTNAIDRNQLEQRLRAHGKNHGLSSFTDAELLSDLRSLDAAFARQVGREAA